MGRPKLARHPKPQPVEPEEESQEVEDDEPATPVAAPKAAAKSASAPPAQPAISKAEGVRRAMAEGLDDLDDIEDFLKKQYGIEMPRPQLSAYKAQAKKKAGGDDAAPKARRGRKPRQAAETSHASQPTKPSGTASGDMYDDLTAIKHLVERLGAEQVRKIVGLFE